MNQKKAGVLLSYGQTALSTLISLTCSACWDRANTACIRW